MIKVPLSKLCSKGVSSLRQKDIEGAGKYPVYGASGICGYLDTYQHEVPYVAVVKDGAGVGRSNVCCGKSSVLGTMQALLPKDDISVKYLSYLIASLDLGSAYTGSTIPHIYFKDYGKRLVPFHEPAEQQRIALELTKIDALIRQHAELINTYDGLVKSRFSWTEVAA